ncbi:hypothetical protein CCACVL1_20872 [Corchorus capsularis]|uniref:Uncharacterized protein n=1 Tax=Corchorus capsularis TaxID=210143 RepID=A0A1R3H9M8_COCAP|nr:hypothetical protein CCACVL1_20872 [Corchorus capsularis]
MSNRSIRFKSICKIKTQKPRVFGFLYLELGVSKRKEYAFVFVIWKWKRRRNKSLPPVRSGHDRCETFPRCYCARLDQGAVTLLGSHEGKKFDAREASSQLGFEGRGWRCSGLGFSRRYWGSVRVGKRKRRRRRRRVALLRNLQL